VKKILIISRDLVIMVVCRVREDSTCGLVGTCFKQVAATGTKTTDIAKLVIEVSLRREEEKECECVSVCA
jgi:hypothetical protein